MDDDVERTAGDDVAADTTETVKDAVETDAPAEQETEDVNSTKASSVEEEDK
jgi:hypothetical protein